MATFRATKLGFYIGRRRPGDVFKGPDDLKGSWFERIDEETATASVKSRKAQKADTMTLAEGGKQAGIDRGQIDLA